MTDGDDSDDGDSDDGDDGDTNTDTNTDKDNDRPPTCSTNPLDRIHQNAPLGWVVRGGVGQLFGLTAGLPIRHVQPLPRLW